MKFSSEALKWFSSGGFRDMTSGPRCHLPGLWTVWYFHPIVDSLKRWSQGLSMLWRSRCSFRMPRRGLWSVETNMLSQPRVNMREWWSAQETAKASPSVGLYPLSAGFVNREPPYINFHPSAQPCLHQSVWMQVGRFGSNDRTPFFTLSNISSLDCSKSSLRAGVQWNLLFGLINCLKGSMMGLIEYAQATWFTRPNQPHSGLKGGVKRTFTYNCT